MRHTNIHFRLVAGAAVLLLAAVREAKATRIVFDGLNASLTEGSLAGIQFPVSFSYDADQILPAGDTYITLNSFDFTLLGVTFNRSGIFQGGQVMFHNGVIENVTASYQVVLPPNPPLNNITFGFGGPGVIGYIDLKGQFGMGSFTFASTTVPEPISSRTVGVALTMLVCGGLMNRRRIGARTAGSTAITAS